MVPASPRATIGVRACRSLAAICLLLLGIGGCSHRRSVYRPIYPSQSAISAPCPSGNCGSVEGATSTISTSTQAIPRSEPGFQDSSGLSSPSAAPTPFGFGSGKDEEPTDLQPVAPPRGTTDPAATKTRGTIDEPEFLRPSDSTSSRDLNRPRIDSNTTRAGIVAPEAPAAGARSLPVENPDEPILAPPSQTSQKSRKSLLSPAKAGQSRKKPANLCE